jgi:hypothetical protein
MGLFFKDEIEKEKKEFDALKFKSKRRNVYVGDHQIGKANRKVDEAREALVPGKRISKNGKIYYEFRKNRTDKPNTNL